MLDMLCQCKQTRNHLEKHPGSLGVSVCGSLTCGNELLIKKKSKTGTVVFSQNILQELQC